MEDGRIWPPLIVLALIVCGIFSFRYFDQVDVANAALEVSKLTLVQSQENLNARMEMWKTVEETSLQLSLATTQATKKQEAAAQLQEEADKKQRLVEGDLSYALKSIKSAVEKIRADSLGTELVELKLTNGKILKNARIRKIDDQSIGFLHSDGISTVPLDQLPPELMEQFDLGAGSVLKQMEQLQASLDAPASPSQTAPTVETPAMAALKKSIAALTVRIDSVKDQKMKREAEVRSYDQQIKAAESKGGNTFSLRSMRDVAEGTAGQARSELQLLQTELEKLRIRMSSPEMAAPPAPASLSTTSATTGTAPATTGSSTSTSFDPSCLVFIKTDSGSGSGFIANTGGKTYIYTNAHVLCGSPGSFTSKIVSIKTAAGRAFPTPYDLELSDTYDPSSPNGLEDAARFPVVLKEGEHAYEIATLENSTAMNQRVTAYGNSLGGDAITSLDGQILGLGTDRIEVSCEIVPGNSGGPVVLTESKRVIGISTYLDSGKRDIWSRGTTFDKMRRFAVRPDKITKWRKMLYTSLMSSLAELKAFDRDTLSLAAACFLNPKPNRGGFDIPSQQRGDFIVKQVIVDGSKHTLGAAISSGIAKVNQRLGAAKSTMAIANVVPVFAEFFASVAQISASQTSSLSIADRSPYLKQFIPAMIEIRKEIHTAFINEGNTRFR